MLTAITTDRGRVEQIEEFCDACGEEEALRRGWPRHDGSVAIGRGWREQITRRRGVLPRECRVCGVSRVEFQGVA